ncbi:MAG: ribose 5-phosphate isomerase B [Bacteroidales bacterium]
MLEFAKKIAIGSDHAGFGLKKYLQDTYIEEDYTFIDTGAFSAESVDYPDFASPVCKAVLDKSVDFGVLLCGTGNGMSISANKFPGIRAALCWTEEIARLARLHNDANVLVLPARFLPEDEAGRIFHIFMITQFEGGRHIARIDKIDKLV